MYGITFYKLLKTLVGAAGFELATPCAQGRCATRLRYAPTLYTLDSKSLSELEQLLFRPTVSKPC